VRLTDRPGPALGAGALIALVMSCAAAAQTARTPPVFRCEGPFGPAGTHADIIKAFPAYAVEEKITGAEGETFEATVLYPKDPARRLEITWADPKTKRRPIIRITGQSAWATPNGVRLGMPLAEIERLNGRPFRLYGFEWDYGGRVASWQGGALGKPLPGGCTLSLSLGIDDKAPRALLDEVIGDKKYFSTNPGMRALAPAVYEITLGYGPREGARRTSVARPWIASLRSQ